MLLLLPVPPLHAPLPPIASAPSVLTSDEALPSGAQFLLLRFKVFEVFKSSKSELTNSNTDILRRSSDMDLLCLLCPSLHQELNSTKTKTHLLHIDGTTIGIMARFIRFPSSSPLGNMVKKILIPKIAYLHRKYPLQMMVFFLTEFLPSFYQTQDINCMDLIKMDNIFDSFGLFNDFIKARDWNSWGECVLEVALPGHSLDLLNTTMFTPIDFSAAAAAARLVSPARQCNVSAYLPTPPRDTPPLAREPSNIESTNDKLFLNPPNWHSPMSHGSLETFRVNFKADRVYNTKIWYPRAPVGRFNEMELQRSLASHAAWPLDLEDFKRKFHQQLTSGQCPNLQTYLGLDTTHLEGQEAKANDEIYKMLSDAFEPVFKWIHDLLRELLPDAFKELLIFVDMLPNCSISPVYPFSGYVLNINVSTRIHRDMGDKDICIVLVISVGIIR
ncbi:hypothetical protein CPB84DRAFT_1841957 [Gymnopilus junonius]|uniref:Uncharacterized protein n=1 Tax=Gymnopilus junonius TaxID=109634 RepID=A0A9P5NYV5_GYMJU|nr:hypothetical protein CPB84DRAFT_1841957 [Gymnopilus junonius]